jgi:hypothetical protein
VAVVGRPVAGLADPRVEAEIGGQLAPITEAADVADLDLRPPQRLGGDELVDLRNLGVEEIDLAQAGLDRFALARAAIAARPARRGPRSRTGPRPAGGP